jgi:hypothetical protein
LIRNVFVVDTLDRAVLDADDGGMIASAGGLSPGLENAQVRDIAVPASTAR